MRRRIATLCGATPESSPTVARTRSSGPGRSTRVHQDRGLRRSVAHLPSRDIVLTPFATLDQVQRSGAGVEPTERGAATPHRS